MYHTVQNESLSPQHKYKRKEVCLPVTKATGPVL